MAKPVHSMIRVFDEAKSLDFYSRAFGLKIADRFDFPDFALVYLRHPSSPFEVELTVNFDRKETYALGDGYGHLAVVVDNLEDEHARFEREKLSILCHYRNDQGLGNRSMVGRSWRRSRVRSSDSGRPQIWEH